MWKYYGQQRPDFAVLPDSGQESVWDYPRPPAIVRCRRLVEVKDGDVFVARTAESFRLLETASPPTYYLPPDAVQWQRLTETVHSTICEWKGAARYWALARNPDEAVAWHYPQPRKAFEPLAEYVAFYPGRIACFVDGERVEPQAGHFYGGWITSDVVGPFKGEPGTGHW